MKAEDFDKEFEGGRDVSEYIDTSKAERPNRKQQRISGKPLEEFKKLHKFYFGMEYLTKDLAAYVGVSPRTIQRWMKGRNLPPEDKIKKIEAFLKQKASPESSRI